jgi:hypothetical protein
MARRRKTGFGVFRPRIIYLNVGLGFDLNRSPFVANSVDGISLTHLQGTHVITNAFKKDAWFRL